MPGTAFVLAQAAHPSLWQLFWEAGPVAKIVFAVLAGMSLGSWAIMIGKAMQYRRATVHGEEPFAITVADLMRKLERSFFHGMDKALAGRMQVRVNLQEVPK